MEESQESVSYQRRSRQKALRDKLEKARQQTRRDILEKALRDKLEKAMQQTRRDILEKARRDQFEKAMQQARKLEKAMTDFRSRLIFINDLFCEPIPGADEAFRTIRRTLENEDVTIQNLIEAFQFIDGIKTPVTEKKVAEAYNFIKIYIITESLALSERELDYVSELVENNGGKTVLPIFYGVDPSDVRKQTGCFAEPFARLEEKYKDDPGKVERWRAALRKLGHLAGWVSKDRHEEVQLIEEVCKEIQRILKSSFSRPALTNGPSPHDVFLSFRGEDTRLTFVKHLYNALIKRKISTFKDDESLRKGMTIRKQLQKAIERSEVWVVIVSPNYASSEWCMDELLKIIQCRKASEVAKKNEMHKKNAGLPNKKNITINKREMGKIILGVNYGGKWVGSVYTGGKTEEIVVSNDITYNKLLDQLYHIVGNEIKISTIDVSKSPAHPVEIINDDDLRTFIDQGLSEESHLKNLLRYSCASRRKEVRILVNYDGEWMNSAYVGGKTKLMLIAKDITYQELVHRVYGVVGVDPNQYKLILKTAYESNLPTQPVEITDDEALAAFLPDENLLRGMSTISTLCTTFERWALPNERMKSSESNDGVRLRRSGIYQNFDHCVTPDQVPHLQSHAGSSSPNVPCMQQQQFFYQYQQHSYQQTPSQPYYVHYQPPFQQPQPPYQQLNHSYMQPQPQYNQTNLSYMQSPMPSHPGDPMPYSLRMFWNDATRKIQDFSFCQFIFIIVLLGIFLFLKGL